jgi:FkbM family methyltransferase
MKGIISFLGRLLRDTKLSDYEVINKMWANVILLFFGKDKIEIDGFQVSLPPQDKELSRRLILYGYHEKEEIRILKSFLSEGDEFLDVGANAGMFTLPISRKVGDKGRVISVEPDPANLRILNKNTKNNNINNVTVIPCAFGQTNESRNLFRVPEHRGISSFANLTDKGEPIEIDVRRGEDVLSEVGCWPEVVKIDVEGAEPQVLEGLGYFPEILLVECIPSQIRALGNDPVIFLSNLKQKGYDMRLIDRRTGDKIECDIKKIVRVTENEDKYRNIIAIRNCTQ